MEGFSFYLEVAAAFAGRIRESTTDAVEEYQKLSAVDWRQRLETERQEQRRLVEERSNLQFTLQHMDSELQQTRCVYEPPYLKMIRCMILCSAISFLSSLFFQLLVFIFRFGICLKRFHTKISLFTMNVLRH